MMNIASPNVAHVFGIGAKYQLGANASVTVDYGQNRSNLGRYLNGNTVYQHERGTADFALKGHEMGGTPHFWMARLDIGRADLDIPKSWNAFIDYNTLLMVHSSVVMAQVLFLIVISMVFAASHLVQAMFHARIYSLKHSIHLMQKGSTNEIPYMDLKTSNLGIILVSK